MSEIRDELEKNFASAETQSNEETVMPEDSQQNDEQSAEVSEVMTAPKSYTKEFQENFKNLSPEWKNYLINREKQTEKGFSELGNKLNAYKWTDKIFEDRQQRLTELGVTKAQDYIEKLVSIDDALAKNPRETLQYLSEIYGNDNQLNENASMTDAQKKMWQKLCLEKEAFDQKQVANAYFDVQRFVNETDQNGNLIHPQYQEVKFDMIDLLKSGGAQNLDEAYQKALWLNSKVRDKMIESKIETILSAKFADAKTAKEAAFSPQSKTEVEPREMTLREELEAQFRKEF